MGAIQIQYGRELNIYGRELFIYIIVGASQIQRVKYNVGASQMLPWGGVGDTL